MVCFLLLFQESVLDTLPIVNPKNGRPAGMISKETYEIVCANAEMLDSAIIYNRDFNYNLYVFSSPMFPVLNIFHQLWLQNS